MTARLPGTIARSLADCILLFQLVAVAGSAQSPAGTAEPPTPKPTATVEKMLTETSRLAEAKQPADSLKTADQALDAARQANDKAGEAFAQQARAKALEDLKLTEEAAAAWEKAARIWSAAGDTPEEITALVHEGRVCIPDHKSKAETLFAQGLAVSKMNSDRPLAVARALHDSGNTLSRGNFIGSYARFVHYPQKQAAWDYLNAALALREEHTADSLGLAATLTALAGVANQFAFSVDDSDKYFSLERDYSARAIEILRRQAPDSALLAEALHWLGNAESNLGDNGAKVPEAEEHFLAALRIQKELAPAGSMEEAAILDGVGRLENKQSNSAIAREHLTQAVAIGERLAPESQEFAYSLEELGISEGDLGDLRAERDKLERVLAIDKKSHAFLAPIYVNLGATTFYQSDYAAARDYFEKAYDLFKTSSTGTFGAAVALGNLGGVYFQLGDLTSALEYHKRALALCESNFPSAELTGVTMHEMGDALKEQGNFPSAADFYQRALALLEKFSPHSPYVAATLGSMATLARVQGNLDLAMEYARKAVETGQQTCPDSWCVVSEINDIGELAYERGDFLSSEKYLHQAVNLRERNLGPAHPDLASSLNDLALTLAAQGKTTEALADALRAERIGAEHLRVSVRTLSERQALAYEGIRASGLDLALTLAGERTSTPSARGQVFDAEIRSRALVFDELAARHRAAYGSSDPEIKQLADQLFSARARLATLVFRGAGDSATETFRKILDDARGQKETAERRLAEKSVAFRQDLARAQLGLNDITASLPLDTALVAFVRYARYDLHRAAGKTTLKPGPSYAAFVLRAGNHEPEVARLGSAREIDRLLEVWRRTIAQQAELADESGNTTGDDYLRAGTALRRKIWDPLVPLVGNAREVFVVPDAGLHLVNLASLPVGKVQFLIETGPLIHYLSTERDLVPVESRRGKGILVVGNPAFDQAGRITLASDRQSTPTGATATATVLLRGTRSGCGTFKTLRFPPLPASQQETDNIAALWKSSTMDEGTVPPTGELLQMTGADASPEAFEQYAPGKRVLHIATHGFFLEGGCESALQRRSDATKQDETFLPATAENPLLLSGLALAGANRRASAMPDEPDGILTAEEIAGINLDGVDWAVLSACDTGVGEIKVGEGVFGLRRAFQVAGAKTVIMSLWQVEDEMTRQWMGSLYREHFLSGKDTAESVRAASLQVLRKRRAKHQSTHPFYWGAFIAAGDWH
jgi:CHAT domain-containing protein/tetratricopeptide (TPR) repeat protein